MRTQDAAIAPGAPDVTSEFIKCFLQGGRALLQTRGTELFPAPSRAPAQLTGFQKVLGSQAGVGHVFDLI